MHYYCTQLCLELLWQTSRSRETQKKSFEEKQIAQEGSNSCPRGHEATALPFALQHLRGVYSRRALIHQAVCTRYTESARVTKWPTECYVVSKKRSNFLTKLFFLKRLFIFAPQVTLKSLVFLDCRVIARGARIERQTHTDTQTKYSNPRCACAPRG